MERIYIEDLKNHIEKEVEIFGWVDIRRDHGKLIFLDLRDTTGTVQMVALPEHTEALSVAEKLRSEFCIKVTGKVNKRPERMIKEGLNGYLEIEILNIEIISESETPPFELTEDTTNVDEEVRLKYRYLDLRTKRMQENIKKRSEWVNANREFLLKNKFTEIETPLLTEATPEGSRDFVVPSRIHQGKFYALPQSPQQYKQLLMVGGFDRYFQMARAMRDEDLRADRGFEHTQIDIEMSFVTQEDVLKMVEEMIIHSAEKIGAKIKEKPFPRFTYAEAIEKFGEDKFDLRTEEEKTEGVLAYAWVVDFPFFEKDKEGNWTFTHNPFSAVKQEHEENLLKGENIESIVAQQYDLVCNGFEVGGGSIRSHKPELLEATYKIMGNSDGEIKEKIGHMLEAFKFGAPSHGGIALGVERNLMTVMNEEALREVQAFPTTRGGQVAMMQAPTELSDKQLKELGLKVDKKND